ncbi:hypothetical protein [Collimonas pratensis]|uniref:hypothetical protein n=1 Tax=Collimonas pratensis TaxID=279113 RepID=UPI0007822638|nr:hypothetical protein [Collimonas pratensis]
MPDLFCRQGGPAQPIGDGWMAISSRAISAGVVIYEIYSGRHTTLNTPRKKYYKLKDLLAEMPAKLPIDEKWGQAPPVGREFGSKHYEYLTELDARARTAKAAFDPMTASRSGLIDQTTFSKMRKHRRR